VLMQGLRDAISAGDLAGYVAGFHAARTSGDIPQL
jgi:queuine tRNA-ribosyltransferase